MFVLYYSPKSAPRSSSLSSVSVKRKSPVVQSDASPILYAAKSPKSRRASTTPAVSRAAKTPAAKQAETEVMVTPAKARKSPKHSPRVTRSVAKKKK